MGGGRARKGVRQGGMGKRGEGGGGRCDWKGRKGQGRWAMVDGRGWSNEEGKEGGKWRRGYERDDEDGGRGGGDTGYMEWDCNLIIGGIGF